MTPSWYGALPFVSWMAHMWFAYALVYTFAPRYHWIAVALVAVMLVKEFVWDKHQETPGQTFMDNLTDWAGYLSGALLALAMLRWYIWYI